MDKLMIELKSLCKIFLLTSLVSICLWPETSFATGFNNSGEITGANFSGKAAWGDVDRDGDLDLVRSGVGAASPTTTRLYLNDGTGNLSVPTTLPTGLHSERDHSLVFADLNADGWLDLIIQGTQNNVDFKVDVFLHSRNKNNPYPTRDAFLSDQVFGVSLPQRSQGNITFGDLDRDGDLDGVQFTGGNTDGDHGHIRIFENFDGGFTDQSLIAQTYDTGKFFNGMVEIGDVRQNDQFPDILFAGSGQSPPDHRVVVFENPSGNLASFLTSSTFQIEDKVGASGSIVIGDLNNDGFTDAVLGGTTQANDQGIVVCTNDGTIGIKPTSCQMSDVKVENGIALALGDLNNDHLLDLGITGDKLLNPTNDFFALCTNTGSGTFFKTAQCLSNRIYGGGNGDIAFADVNGDRFLDIVALGDNKNAALLFHDASDDPNILPRPPVSNFASTYNPIDTSLTFRWNAMNPAKPDDEAISGLYYELQVFTEGETDNLVSGAFGSPLLGNAMIQNHGASEVSYTLRGFDPQQELRWRVRTIDQSLAASPWSDEQRFQGIQNAGGWGYLGTALDAAFHFGWLNLNCSNLFFGNPEFRCTDAEYGMKINSLNGDVSGFGWIGGSGESTGQTQDCDQGRCPLGWLDFDPNPFPASPANAPIFYPEGQYPDRPNQLHGWSRVLSLQQEGIRQDLTDWGWVRFGAPGSGYAAWVDTSTNPWELRGYLYIGGGFVGPGESSQDVGLGWVSLNCKDREGNVCTNQSDYRVWMEPIGPPEDGDYELRGYGWIGTAGEGDSSPSIGWLSFSCKNRGTCEENDYRVKFDGATNRLYGFAWMGGAGSNPPMQTNCDDPDHCPVGWIEINQNAFPTNAPFPATFFDDEKVSVVNPENPQTYYPGQIAGWARLETLKQQGLATGQDDWGWVRLQGDRKSTNPATDRYVNCQVCTSNGGGNDQCLYCDLAQSNSYSGFCSDCSSCNSETGECQACEVNACYAYGANLNFENGQLEGWVFSGDPTHESASEQDVIDKGAGWILLQSRVEETQENPPQVVAPYVETTGGLYAKEGIGDLQTFAPPAGLQNAFLIQSSGDVLHFEAQEQGGGTAADPFAPPVPANRYSNALGKLDLEATTTIIADNKNIYGSKVIELPSATTSLDLFSRSDLWTLPDPTRPSLAGSVIVIQDGDFTVNATTTFQNGTTGVSGAGLIVVENGDLRIEHDVSYDLGPIALTSELASVAFIVRNGDIIVDDQVQDLNGVYMALGEDGVSGNVSSGLSDLQLRVRGLLFAKNYQFQRSFIGSPSNPQPAEWIHYDGRLLTNTPPGLRDFSKVLPLTLAQ